LLGAEFGRRSIAEITPQELLHELKKHERRGRLETTKQLRSFASRVFRYGAATARAENDPAQLLLGALTSPPVTHFAAITDPQEFGGLLRAIEDYQGDPSVIYALKLTPHAFQRPGEIRQLSGAGRFVFPSVRTSKRPISNNSINAALRRMGYTKDQMTAHGFRTTASSLLNESGKWNPDAIERALAHMVAGSVRRIYNQSAYWSERVDMAQWWSDYIDGLQAGESG
jgi:integrase